MDSRMPRRKPPKKMAKKMPGSTMKDRASRVTIIDVAKRAGVHWSTVSRALNPEKRHLISPEMIERVAACVQELGYRANAFRNSAIAPMRWPRDCGRNVRARSA